ncbi:MAG: DUF1292 domain-containing protein [Alphaproteobacteria bacterium]|nr:DUF1292 domain-containing protein [Alphaproteobacteria bacterium]
MTDADPELDIVTLTDEEGNDRDFAILAVFPVGDDGQFALLAPVDELDSGEPDLDLYAFRYLEDDDGVDLEAVEDEDLLDRIFAEADRVLFEDEEDEDEDGDDLLS